MKILFLCSSLEPGRDGVGDYTRLLAEECVRQGHTCALLALHDRHITEPIEDRLPVSPSSSSNVSSAAPDGISASQDVSFSESQPLRIPISLFSEFPSISDQPSAIGSIPPLQPISLLRLPVTMPWRERVNRAVAFRSDFQPDWISLQFVPYGFQDKGVIAGLANHLQRIAGSSSKFHIMFHELWIGIEHAASVKRRLIGALQRRFVFDMIRKLKPAVIHTNTPLYEMILQQWGFTASVLPLFGNISICAHGDAQWLWDELGAAGCQVTNKNRSKFWLAGFFGTLHSEWEPEPFLGLLHRAAEDTGRRVCLLALGRLGTGNARWDDLARRNADNFFFAKIGEQAGNRISQCLQSLDFGVAVSPLQLIGKSSTTATMLDHGLPVVVTRCNARSSIPFIATPFTDPLIHLLDDSFSSKLANGFPKREARHRLQSVAKRFLHQFTYNEDGARKQYEHI